MQIFHIERQKAVGLKGKKIGDMEFSNTHANFLVNHGNGTFDESITLINLAKQKVKEQFNIELETEIIIFEQIYTKLKTIIKINKS